MAPTLYLLDRFDARLGITRTAGAITHTEEVGGEDTLEFDCWEAPEKGCRLVWRDPVEGIWREHVVVRTDEPMAGVAHAYAESSLCELLGDFIEETQLVAKSAVEALAAALAPTRWSVGTVGVGADKCSCLLYHTNALAALRRVEDLWGGEIEVSISVSDGRVASRTLSLPARRGSWRGARFCYGKNLAACTRTVLEDEVFTALYGYGMGLPIVDETGAATGGYTRRLSFADVNGGVSWVGNEAARLTWGRPDSDGLKIHRFGCVLFSDCNDAAKLLRLTRAALARTCVPKVSYELDAALVAGGATVRLGDDVAVLDMSRTPEWRLRARCMRRVHTFGEGAPVVRMTLSSVERTTWAASAEVVARVNVVEGTAAGAADAVASYENLGMKEY